MRRITLGEWIEDAREAGKDKDIAVDGFETIAYCGTKLTAKGWAEYGDILGLPMMGDCVISDDDADYEFFDGEDLNGSSKLVKAWQLFCDMAGYCDSKWYDEMFE